MTAQPVQTLWLAALVGSTQLGCHATRSTLQSERPVVRPLFRRTSGGSVPVEPRRGNHAATVPQSVYMQKFNVAPLVV